MTTAVNANDPRVKRTRQLLLQAFWDLVGEKKNFHSISVQDITERATVNRATFYAHFEDKYALLESWIRMKFQKALERELSTASSLTLNNLQVLVRAVFDFLATFRSYQRPGDKQYEPLFEVALQQELYELFLNWLNEAPTLHREANETTAQVISWAIFGPAVQWSRGEQKCSAEEMVRQVLVLVAAGLSPEIALT